MFVAIKAKIDKKMTLEAAVKEYVSETAGTKVHAIMKAYQREKQRHMLSGELDAGHGNAMLTNREEFIALTCLLDWANANKAGIVPRLVSVVEEMGLLGRWTRDGQDNSVDELRRRAISWADNRVTIWRNAGFVEKKRPSALTKERAQKAQQLADGEAFFDRLTKVWDAQGHVPLTSVANCDEFLVRIYDETVEWVRVVDPNDVRPQVATNTRGHNCASVLLFTDAVKTVHLAIVCLKSPKKIELADGTQLFTPAAKLPQSLLEDLNTRIATKTQPYIYFCASESGFFDAQLFETVSTHALLLFRTNSEPSMVQ